MSSYLHVGALVGFLMACLIFASYEICNDLVLLGRDAGSARSVVDFDAKRAGPAAAAAAGGRASTHNGANTGYLVFFSEVSPKTNRRRDRMGFYMKQFGADGTFNLEPTHTYVYFYSDGTSMLT